jgi:hypothetical protein
MDSELIEPESVDISQLLGGDIAKLPQNEELSIPQSPTIAGGLIKPSKPFTKSSKTAKPIANSFDPDLNLPMTAVPAAYWECRGTEMSRDRARRCVPQLLRYQMGMLSFLSWLGFRLTGL